MTLVLDGWGDVRHEHVVNFVAINSSSAVFIDSIVVGSVNRTAENQTTMVQNVLEPFRGVKGFAAIITDNNQSCVNVRSRVNQNYPGIVSLNDQSHVSDLLVENISKFPWVESVFAKATLLSNYIIGRPSGCSCFTLG